MTIKRKTQLNLSGSHRDLDADFAHIGSALFVTGSSQFTGSVNVDDVLSASGDLSTAGILRVQGGTQLTGALNLAADLSASGNITSAGVVSGSTGRFTYLSGALSASSTGLPFLVAGSNITANWSNTNLNWEITGSGGGATPAGVDRTVQFNNNGAFAGDPDLQFYSNSLGNIGANTLAFPSGNVGVLSGSNIDNQAYTLVFSGAVASIPGGQGGPFPGVFDPAMVVLTPVLMSQSFMLFDGYHDPLGLGDSEAPPGGGLALANDAKFTLYSGSWTPLPSDIPGGKDPLVSIFNQGERGIISVVGQLTVQSSSTDQNNIFQVGASNTAGQVQLTNVGTADFISGAVRLTYGSEFTVFSGSGGTAQFTVYPSLTSGKVDASLNGLMTIMSGSLYVNSGSSSDGSFQIVPSATAGQVNVIFDRDGSTVEGQYFQGINVRPLYVTMSTVGATGTELSGTLLANNLANQSIGKLDFNVIAASAADDYASFTFSATVRRNSSGATSVISYTELDSALEGAAATAPWDVNISDNGTIYCTGSAGTVHWYAQVTKKMVLSGSGLITY